MLHHSPPRHCVSSTDSPPPQSSPPPSIPPLEHTNFRYPETKEETTMPILTRTISPKPSNPNNQAVPPGTTIAIMLTTFFVLACLISLLNDLARKRTPPATYLCTTYNPLVLLFTFPWHLKRLADWLRNRRSTAYKGRNPSPMPNDDDVWHSHDVELGAGRRVPSAQPSSNWISAGSAHHGQPQHTFEPLSANANPNVDLPNQTYLSVRHIVSPDGQAHIVLVEHPRNGRGAGGRGGSDSVRRVQPDAEMRRGSPYASAGASVGGEYAGAGVIWGPLTANPWTGRRSLDGSERAHGERGSGVGCGGSSDEG
ncbi:uncharacterized protein EI97DRAFT_236704 [Westerdykella ornata]|uniref:Uncharacterized protein n=1 Tax=Westerdykella ornata TaxID=318751 RepID=A0A6A6J8N9_WESOR|nr:uncharacterized protein EI97DRAFT_236704 [Westerdykella ornata]KAF2272006.1 hypothetical protein EI97DRAFT_236704 [Westerdykella ornata]